MSLSYPNACPSLGRSTRLLLFTLSVVALGLHTGCDNDEVTPTDTIAPAAVEDLSAAATSLTTARLAWTAPGDDEDEGTASRYDVRHSPMDFSAAAWDTLQQIVGEPVPQVAGSPESLTVTDLSPDRTYYFALKSKDDGGNWSGLSNVVQATMADTAAPAAITDLAVATVTTNTVTLAWTAPGDNANVGTAASYDLRYSDTSILGSDWDDLQQVAGEPTPQAAGGEESFTVTGLLPTATYEFAIKSVDEAGHWSGISNIVSATLERPEGVWLVNPDGSGHATTIGAVIPLAADGDTILIAAGTYEEALQIEGRSLVMIGAGALNTVIQYDSQPEDRPLLEVTRDANLILQNMRLYQDFISCGTGVDASYATLHIIDCALTWCGITAEMVDLTLDGCTIWEVPEMTCEIAVPLLDLVGGSAQIEQCLIGGYPRIKCSGGVNATFVCNNFWRTRFAGDCEDPTGSDGNLARDPLFVIEDPTEDNFDFRLRPGSPCLEGSCGQIGVFGPAPD